MKKSLISLLTGMTLCLGLVQPTVAQYKMRKADAQYELYNYAKAIDLYEQVYKRKPSLHAAERLAESYEQMHNYKQTESWSAIAAGMKGSDSENVLRYAKALQQNSKYSEAKMQYERYAEMNNKVDEAQKKRWLLSCDSAVYWMKNPRATAIENLQELNTAQSDWGAVQASEIIVFASDRDVANSSTQPSKPFLKFDGAKKPDNKIYGWTGNHYLHLYEQGLKEKSAKSFELETKGDYHIGPASFTADGKEMYFTLTRIPPNPVYVKGKLATVNIEIYSSKKGPFGEWTSPVTFAYNKVNEYSVGDPYISKDGNVLYFVSNMPGGSGGADLYYCLKTSNGEWGQPINLKEMNTAGDERSPFFDGDKTFYFSSDGRVGMGGLDIFKSVRVLGKLSTPVNMGYPFNSPQDDFAYNNTSQIEGYLSSNRTGGQGSDDIYIFKAQAPSYYILSGAAYNKKTNQPIGNAVISLTKSTGDILNLQTEADGRYTFKLEKSMDYLLKGDKTDFRAQEIPVSTQALAGTTTLQQNLYLEPIDINKSIKLENIYYDFDKSNIRSDAAKELEKLVKIMEDNPTMCIELGSHTDLRGSETYNQWLSQSRANSAVQYLIDRGINKNRITAVGYGESRLKATCPKHGKCSEAIHQQNRRTEFKIVKY